MLARYSGAQVGDRLSAPASYSLSLMRRDFGNIVKIYTMSTGSCQDEFHCSELIPGAIAASAQRRNLCEVASDQQVVFEEDCAPSHIGDNDCHTLLHKSNGIAGSKSQGFARRASRV